MANPTTNYGFVLPTPTDLVTDLPADFDVALQGVDTRLKALQPGTTLGDLAYSSATANTNTRLAVGTTGQVLTVAAGVPSWATPTAGMTNPMTTTGDTIYSSSGSTPARLGIGTAGQVLKVNSGATAPEWGSVAATKSFSLLGTGTLTSASTVTVSGISNMDRLMVLIDSGSADSDSIITIRINADTAANYSQYGQINRLPTTYDSNALREYQQTSATSIQWVVQSNISGSYFSGYIDISGAATSGIKIFSAASGVSGGDNKKNYVTSGIWNNTSTITSISLISSSGNFDQGSFKVYGAA